jgi:Zn-dependent protease
VNIRPLHQSVRPSPVFLAIVALTAAGGVLAWLATDTKRPIAYIGVILFVVAGWVVSLCLHEFAHAFSAWRFGDRDVEVRGYLTLNPLKYAHPLLSIGLPVLIIAIGGIGLPGGAVYVRTSWMTKRQKTVVSLAGPFTNLAFAAVLLAVTTVMWNLDPSVFLAHLTFWGGMAFLGFLQLTAFLLNILPVPGFDGYGALEPHLSPATQRAVAPAKGWAFFVVLLLLFTPGINGAFFSVVDWFFALFGIPGGLWQWGSQLTRFWSAWF